MKVSEIHYSQAITESDAVVVVVVVVVVDIVDLILLYWIHHLTIDSTVNWDLL